MKGKHLGELEELILLTVTSIEGEAYGISIQNFLHAEIGRKVSIGALHSSITRLEEKGFLKSEIGKATAERGGRRKRLYTITASGVEELNAIKKVRDHLWTLSSQTLSPNA